MTSPSRIILTRQEQRNQTWHQSLVKAGIEVLDLPLVRFETLEIPAEYLDRAFHWILFTSPQSVDVFIASALEIKSAKLGALGAGTSAALSANNLSDDLGFNGLDGAELATAFINKVSAPAMVLLPGAARRMADPRETLNDAGFQVTELSTYETLPVHPHELTMDFRPRDIVFFCSPSAVRAFIGAFTQRPQCVAIGETTATVCREHKFPTLVAQTPDLEAMVRASGCGPLTTSLENES